MPKPSARDWRTTDEQEIQRRRDRARSESFTIRNLDPAHPVYANFSVRSASGGEYQVEVRNPCDGHFACTCPDFRINGLGTCKHIEAVRLDLEQNATRAWQQALGQGHGRVEIVPDRIAGTLRLEAGRGELPQELALMFDDLDLLRGFTPEEALETLRNDSGTDLRISQEVEPWLGELQETRARMALRRDYEERVRAGDWPAQETRRALRNHERQGMLHLAFTGRALLADEFCVDKAVQAIAACALLYRLERARRVIVVAPPARLESWQTLCREILGEPVEILTQRPATSSGSHALQVYVTSYDQIIAEAEAVQTAFAPEIVVLDEAQRMRNWTSPAALAVKKLQSSFAFVLADTEFENRLDELYAVMDFVSPDVLGPLFRFNRNFYVLNDEGRPVAAKNLEALRARLQPVLLRRERREVEAELPEQTWRAYLCPMDSGAQDLYLEERARLRQLLEEDAGANRLRAAGERLGRIANGLEPSAAGALPGKLQELRALLPQLLVTPESHVAIFASFEPPLQQVRDLCDDLGITVAWLAGSGSPRARSVQITKFKADPECRVLLALDTAAAGLNLRNCSCLVHLDVPAQRATIENRAAAVWRRDVCPPLAHVLLAAENTHEHQAARFLEHATGGPWPDWPTLLDLATPQSAHASTPAGAQISLQAFKRTLRRRVRDEMGIDPGEIVSCQVGREEMLLVEVAPNAPENLDNIQQWLEEFREENREKLEGGPTGLLAVSRRQKKALLSPSDH